MPEGVRTERVLPERIGVLLVDAAAVAVGRGDAGPRPVLAGSGSCCVRPQRVPEGIGVLFVGSLAAAVAVGWGNAGGRPVLAGSGSGCVRPQWVPEGVGILFVGSLAAAVAGRVRMGLLFAARL